ncbi:uncharacterized protein LAJ45_06639 [Morchella importuna]|uniref:uncharacterized protein n=1 Tax=Morchella importuna TaxID=1174673 RepID=UPI001E8D6503|nr:uncharacterized protein LAJ45_06639 [Morchella importuna]KAH8149100.1 hypothetical protein LAJ45_06639 [Morchella importuna]
MTESYFEFFEADDPKEEDLIGFIESHPSCASEKSTDDHEWSSLYHATRAGYNNIVKALLKHKPEVEFKDSHGRTPLWIAASKGEDEIVNALLQSGASPLVECCTCKTSVLHIAVQKRHFEVELVERGASKSIENDDKKTLEMLVTEAGDGVYVDGGVEYEITGRIRPIPAPANDIYDGDDVDNYDYDNDPYLNKFLDHIEDRGLEAFFTRNGADLKESLRPYTIQARKLIKELNAEKEESASEVALLTLYDLAILIDDSTSMQWVEQGKRIQVLVDFLKAISHIYSFAGEGMNGKIRRIRFLNSRKGSDYVDSAEVEKLLHNHSYSGMTRIGTQLKKKILIDLVSSKMPRPLLVMIITDGEIQGERKNVLFDVLTDVYSFCKNFATGEYAVSFKFCRIGDDQGAKDLLQELDDHKDLGVHIDCQRAHVDLASILNRTQSFHEVTKLLIGAISQEWDDES